MPIVRELTAEIKLLPRTNRPDRCFNHPLSYTSKIARFR